MFITRSLDVTPKTTEQHLIVGSDKCEAELTIKDCARGTVLLKLTTDGQRASRGLSATAELPVRVGFMSFMGGTCPVSADFPASVCSV